MKMNDMTSGFGMLLRALEQMRAKAKADFEKLTEEIKNDPHNPWNDNVKSTYIPGFDPYFKPEQQEFDKYGQPINPDLRDYLKNPRRKGTSYAKSKAQYPKDPVQEAYEKAQDAVREKVTGQKFTSFPPEENEPWEPFETFQKRNRWYNSFAFGTKRGDWKQTLQQKKPLVLKPGQPIYHENECGIIVTPVQGTHYVVQAVINKLKFHVTVTFTLSQLNAITANYLPELRHSKTEPDTLQLTKLTRFLIFEYLIKQAILIFPHETYE